MEKYKSRRKTPWEGDEKLTLTQEFLKRNYENFYAEHHNKVEDRGEADMINSYVPTKCPHCEYAKFKKNRTTKSGVQRYVCPICGKTFLPTTGKIFDEHRISISQWIEYCLNIFHHANFIANSWNSKNDFKTSRYWLQKLFLIPENIQENTVI